MSVTEKGIKNLTPEHRIVWKDPRASREVELGLWVDGDGCLYTDAGQIVRWGEGTVSAYSLNRIVRIIEPTLTPPGPVARGLAQSAAGDVVDLGEFTQYVSEEDQSGERVKPPVEDVARVLAARWWTTQTGETEPWESLTPEEQTAVIENNALDQIAPTVLALFPGRTETEVKAEGWDEGAQAGLDAGLSIAEKVHANGGTLTLAFIPNAPVNPYRKEADRG